MIVLAQFLRVARRARNREAGDVPQVASDIIPNVVAMEMRQMAQQNLTWVRNRSQNELLLKLGLRVSPRTVRKYLDSFRPRGTTGGQRWSTFVRNHARGIVACDFFVSITSTFQVLYVFVALKIPPDSAHQRYRSSHRGVDHAVPRLLRYFNAGAWRLALRIQPGKGGCVMPD